MTAVPVPALAELVKQLNGYRNGMLSKIQPGGKFDPSMKCSHSSADILGTCSGYPSKSAAYKNAPQQADLQFNVCMLTPTVHFTFAAFDTAITINVPFSELVLPAPWDDNCVFALQPKPKDPSRPYWFNFGSSVVDSMYLVVDYDMNTIQIAKANYDGRAADILPISHR